MIGQTVWDKDKLNRPNTLFYVPSLNRFIDEQWYIIHDLHKLFNTWQLVEWRKNKKDVVMDTKDGRTIELFYLNEDEEDEVLDFLSWNESYDIKMDRLEY